MNKQHNNLANCIRFLSIDAVQKANSGHPGMPMGMADVATILFQKFLKFNPKNPDWLNRDRFILSAGHGSMLLYSLLYLTGYKSVSLKDIREFRQLKSIKAGRQGIIQLWDLECVQYARTGKYKGIIPDSAEPVLYPLSHQLLHTAPTLDLNTNSLLTPKLGLLIISECVRPRNYSWLSS